MITTSYYPTDTGYVRVRIYLSGAAGNGTAAVTGTEGFYGNYYPVRVAEPKDPPPKNWRWFHVYTLVPVEPELPRLTRKPPLRIRRTQERFPRQQANHWERRRFVQALRKTRT